MTYLCICPKCNHERVYECIRLLPNNEECKCCTYEEDGTVYHREEYTKEKKQQ